MARGRQKQLDRMEKMEEIAQKEIKPYFCFPELPLTNTKHLAVEDLSVGYYFPVLTNLNFQGRFFWFPMQINRLLEMIYLLLNKESITASEPAEHFFG